MRSTENVGRGGEPAMTRPPGRDRQSLRRRRQGDMVAKTTGPSNTRYTTQKNTNNGIFTILKK